MNKSHIGIGLAGAFCLLLLITCSGDDEVEVTVQDAASMPDVVKGSIFKIPKDPVKLNALADAMLLEAKADRARAIFKADQALEQTIRKETEAEIKMKNCMRLSKM